MSTDADTAPRLEFLLARLLHYGTWLASTIIGLGLLLAFLGERTGARPFGMRIVTLGIAFFILLPVLRVTLTLVVFARERDYRFVAITAFVLLMIIAGFAIGMSMSSPPA